MEADEAIKLLKGGEDGVIWPTCVFGCHGHSADESQQSAQVEIRS